MTAPGAIPEAWPLLLTREQLCAYLGGISAPTLGRICPVAPLDLGVHLLRYDRRQIDAWIAGLPPRLPRGDGTSQDAPPAPDLDAAESRTDSAIERAAARAKEGTRTWRKAG